MTNDLVSTLKLTPAKGGCEGDKRQHVPFKVAMPCPSCGREWKADLSKDKHLSRVQWSVEATLFAYCDDCDSEWQIYFTPTIALEVQRIDYEPQPPVEDEGEDE